MKANIGLFGGLGVFVLLIAIIYGLWTGFEDMAGFPLLLLTSGMAFMLWFYLRMVAKNHEVLDSDNPEGEIEHMAGNYGEFSPWSWWPIGLGFSAAFAFLGLAIDWWVFFLALIPGLFFITGWVLEFNRKRYAH